MFAIITPALITGAFTNRVTFKAYMLFLTGWLTFVYFPFVHMVWGGGILAKWGVLDFAGGIVVHNIAGHRRPRLDPLRRQAQGRGPRAAPHPARRARHRPPLVRLVRLQRGERVPGRLRHGRRLPQHRPRRQLRRHRLARHGLDDVEEAEVPRPPHGRRRGPGDDHPGRGLRLAHHRLPHRRHRRRRLLLRRRPEEQARLGRRPRRLGRPRRRRLHRDHPLRHLRHDGLQPGGRRRPPPRQHAASSSSSSSPSRSRRRGRSSSRTECSG